nr:MAG TPA: hypothetical protein [Caudoviricetes sp.]
MRRQPPEGPTERQKMNKIKTRIEAARELLAVANCYEPRRLKLATVYRKIRRLPNGNWHMTGRAHDYTA